MTAQQSTLADIEGRAAFAVAMPYDALPERLRSGWKAAATEFADKARRERLTKNPELRDHWDKDPI